jgi:hypothetical protein
MFANIRLGRIWHVQTHQLTPLLYFVLQHIQIIGPVSYGQTDGQMQLQLGRLPSCSRILDEGESIRQGRTDRQSSTWVGSSFCLNMPGFGESRLIWQTRQLTTHYFRLKVCVTDRRTEGLRSTWVGSSFSSNMPYFCESRLNWSMRQLTTRYFRLKYLTQTDGRSDKAQCG